MGESIYMSNTILIFSGLLILGLVLSQSIPYVLTGEA